VVGFGTSSVEPLCSATIDLVILAFINSNTS